jgi:hypothetical protein
MAYEATPIGNNVPGEGLPKEIMREERVVDHRADGRRLQVAQAAVAARTESAKSGQVNTIASNDSSAESQNPSVESVTLSPAAAALARKEQKFRQQQQELKAKEQELEADRAAIAEYKALKAKLAAKDYSDVEKLVDYSDYSNYLIEKGNVNTPEQEEIKRLSAKLDDIDKAQKDDVSKRFDAAVNERRSAVKQLVGSDAAFSTIKELKAEEAVVTHILDTWEHDSVDLTVEQAAKEVEDLLLEKATKWSQVSKIKPQATQEKKELPPLKSGVKTLTNNMAPTGEIKRPQKSYEGMSETERYKEARRRAEEKLKG